MPQQTFNTGSNIRIVIHRCHGDLTATGEDRQDVVVRGDRSLTDHVTQNDGELVISGGQGDLHLTVPFGATVVGMRVSGDVELTNLAGAEFESVGGDVTARDLGALTVSNTGGDLEARFRGGPAQIGRVGGDVELHQVTTLVLDTVGGDAELNEVEEIVSLGRIGGDLSLHWAGRLSANTQTMVGGDAEVHLLPEASFTLRANVGGDASGEGMHPTQAEQEEASVKSDLWNIEAGGGELVVTFGDGMTTLVLRVGGDLDLRGGQVTGASFSGGMQSDFFGGDFAGIGDEMRRFGREMKNMGRQIAREVAREVRTSTRSAAPGARPRMQVQFNDKSFQFDADQIDRLTREAREAAASGVARAQEAVERALVNMVSQRDRARGPVPPNAPRPPQGVPGAPSAPRPSYTGQTVRIEREAPAATSSPEETQAEKLAILRMVSEGRLAIDEAESMLRALEGRGS